MKKIISFLSFLLIIAMISGILISCGNNTATEKTDAKPTVVDTSTDNDNQIAGEEATQEPQDRIKPDVPEDKDYEGYTFTFLAHRIGYAGDWVGDSDPREIIAEEQNSDPINDAVYKRNLAIKEKYNIDIKMIPADDERSAMNKAVKAGDDIYDAVVMFNNNIPTIVTGGFLVNVDKLPYIDISQPWWDPAVNSMSIDHKNYLLGGDLLILDNEATNVLLFNKNLMANLGIDLPYNLVKNGKWTMDKMNEMIKGAALDVDGDGAMGLNDRWGFGVFNDTLHALLVSGGGAFAVKNEDDIPYMDFASQKNLAVLDKAMNLMYNPEYVNNQQAAGGLNHREIFEDNRMVFLWGRVFLVGYFRGMESNFGIVPLPKYDESQDKYYSLVNPYSGVLLGVPKSVQNLERSSIILEALSAESKYTLRPAYYDLVLQRKYVRDDESGEMLDIIFDSKVYDIGGVYSFGDVFTKFNNLAAKQDRNIASFYEANSDKMTTSINKVVTAFQTMD